MAWNVVILCGGFGPPRRHLDRTGLLLGHPPVLEKQSLGETSVPDAPAVRH